MAKPFPHDSGVPKSRSKPTKAAPLILDGAMGVQSAYASILENALAHMEANERGAMSAVNPEFLHQMRVALRRMRSAIAIFREKHSPGLIEDSKWLAGVLGKARDWDVFVLETLPSMSESATARSDIDELRRRSVAMRERAWLDARHALQSQRYGDLKQTLLWAARGERQPSQEELHGFAVAILQRRYAKTCKRACTLSRQSWDELHELRISIKKLRYPVEFFGSLFEASCVRALRDQLAALQDILGTMNDAATAQELARVVAPDTSEAVQRIETWVHERIRERHEALGGAWKAFRRTDVFW